MSNQRTIYARFMAASTFDTLRAAVAALRAGIAAYNANREQEAQEAAGVQSFVAAHPDLTARTLQFQSRRGAAYSAAMYAQRNAERLAGHGARCGTSPLAAQHAQAHADAMYSEYTDAWLPADRAIKAGWQGLDAAAWRDALAAAEVLQ